MDRGSGLSKNHIAKLLLLASLVAGAVHITAASPPESLDSISNEDSSLTGTQYKEATIEQLGHYDKVWTDLNPESDNGKGVCNVTGYYDDSILTTPASVQLCFSVLRSSIMSDYMSGGIYYSDTFYPNSYSTYCFVICREGLDASTPESSDSTSTGLLQYKEATIEQLGHYDKVWTDLNPESDNGKGVCNVTGYYDDSILTTRASVQLCFSVLRSSIVSDYMSGGIYYSDTFYPNSDESESDSTYCFVICQEQAPPGSSAAIPSVPLSNAILFLGLFPLIMLALN